MTVGIQKKPTIDLDAMETARLEEEARADKIIEKAEIPEKKEIPVETPKVPEKPVTDWETKYKESQKEAMILAEQIKRVEEEKTKKIEITDEYLQGKYPEWEEMTLGEQKALRQVEIQAQEIQEIKNNANKFNNDREWNEKVDNWINEEMLDLFPKISGREEEFKRFSTRPTRKGLPIDDLAKIFLFENPITEKKRSLFHAPGGDPPVQKDDGMSAEEAAELMRTKPLEYMRLIRSKKLKIKVD